MGTNGIMTLWMLQSRSRQRWNKLEAYSKTYRTHNNKSPYGVSPSVHVAVFIRHPSDLELFVACSEHVIQPILVLKGNTQYYSFKNYFLRHREVTQLRKLNKHSSLKTEYDCYFCHISAISCPSTSLRALLKGQMQCNCFSVIHVCEPSVGQRHQSAGVLLMSSTEALHFPWLPVVKATEKLLYHFSVLGWWW